MVRRVVITGLGGVTALGRNVNSTWKNIIQSRSGINRITRFDIENLSDGISKVASEVNLKSYDDKETNADGIEDELIFDPVAFIEKKDLKKMDKFIWYGIGASEEAIKDSGWFPTDEYELERTGVIVGSGIGGLTSIQDTSMMVVDKGVRRISPFFIPASLINLISGHISIRYGFTGPNLATVTACATGTHAIGEAMEIIKRDDADVMVAGGAESAVCEIGIGGFSAMHALSTKYNNDPQKASRPWDKDRDGFVMGEGAGIVVLEEYEHAKKRGANIYAEVIGYGISGDAFHITSPESSGAGAKRSMKMAMRKAQLNPNQIDYINAHGTSTPMGDAIEFNAIRTIFDGSLDKILMSSTKSAIGHLLGAAGSIETIFCIKAIQDGIAPPTLNLDNQSDDCLGIDLVPNKAKEKVINIALSNSFGFGGTNASIILKKI
jgi:3-oxoacyl-[acyl-carrier-protein] synthase II